MTMNTKQKLVLVGVALPALVASLTPAHAGTTSNGALVGALGTQGNNGTLSTAAATAVATKSTAAVSLATQTSTLAALQTVSTSIAASVTSTNTSLISTYASIVAAAASLSTAVVKNTTALSTQVSVVGKNISTVASIQGEVTDYNQVGSLSTTASLALSTLTTAQSNINATPASVSTAQASYSSALSTYTSALTTQNSLLTALSTATATRDASLSTQTSIFNLSTVQAAESNTVSGLVTPALNDVNSSIVANAALSTALSTAGLQPTYGAITGVTTSATIATLAISTAQSRISLADQVIVNTARTASQLTAAAAQASGTTEASGAIARAAETLQTAVDTGSYFETEVLGALVDHETRISANEKAITDETKARIDADAVLTASINTEVTRAKAAEAVLDGKIVAETNARIAADTAETNARIAADTALGTRITNETNDRIAADNLLRDQIASSTATAIALGGAVILPDTNFTLSGSVGFYQGAQAIAINGAARISPNTYVTGAFGGGLNKDGKIGGRVGVVIGF